MAAPWAQGGDAPSLYVGAAACARCHEEIHRAWSGARHGRMLQPATPSAVLGDFRRGAIVLRGSSFRLRTANGSYYIAQTNPSTAEREYHVDYTLGSRRVQHYLTTLADGRIVVLPPSWDVQRKEWFHNMDIVNPEESDNSLVQVWNKNCYSCHVSREEKNFDAARNTYHTRWQDFGTNCERCHGPGAEHVARHHQSSPVAEGVGQMVVPTKLSPDRATMVCAQCHSLRNIVAEGYSAGANYFDYFLPILEYGQKVDNDAAYWPDGRPRRFSNDAIGFWQSECFLKGGATCTSCHKDVHDPEIEKNAALRPQSNSICAQCHSTIAENPSAHSHHRPASAGTSCVECHMPRTVFSIKAEIRDHSLSIPAPENTIRYAIPNACNACHRDRTAKWALAAMKLWYGEQRRQKLVRRAAAFTGARNGDRAAIDPLLAMLADRQEGAVARANAAGHLSRFSGDPRVFPALERALADPEPLVRAVASQRIESKTTPGAAVDALKRALGDPVRSVRVGAVLSLVNMRAVQFSGEDARLFEQAKQEYLARAEIQADDGPEQLNVGTFQLLLNNPRAALEAFENSVRLDSRLPARYPLACAYLQMGQVDQATRILQLIQPSDPNFAQAKQLLGVIAAKSIGPHP
jgi:predicted CXXCH cytochrome family protein